MLPRTLALALLCIPLVGCVTRERYDAALADADRARADAVSCEAQRAREREQAVALQKKLDGATAVDAALRDELRRLGSNADALLKERGQLASTVAEMRARLEQLRQAQAAADARAALFRDLALKFQRMIDAGSLRIVLRDGRMVLVLSNDVLFDSGKVDLKPAGRDALAQVADVLAGIAGRHFQVAGHTDNVPISTSRFPSNWELSTARAVEVVHFLVAKGVGPSELSAAGYGEFDPVAMNDTTENKAKNRRIEITLVPNIHELVTVPRP